MQEPAEARFEFVTLQGGRQRETVGGLQGQITEDRTIRFLDSFSAFIRLNQFTKRFQSLDADLLPLIQKSTALHQAAVAIGALHASRHSSVRTLGGQKSPSYVAIESYRSSILSLQTRLAEGDAARGEDVIWSTFLLGLFEVCQEAVLLNIVPTPNLAEFLYSWSLMHLATAGPSTCSMALPRSCS